MGLRSSEITDFASLIRSLGRLQRIISMLMKSTNVAPRPVFICTFNCTKQLTTGPGSSVVEPEHGRSHFDVDLRIY